LVAIEGINLLKVNITEENYPAGHGSHGTPDPMKKRIFRFDFREGEAQVDQTDYGHPGRMNPCYPQVIPTKVQAKTPLILAAAEALAKLL
jgi:hypothetical protein